MSEVASSPPKRRRGPGRPFPKGASGNPGGRPADGSRRGSVRPAATLLRAMRRASTREPAANEPALVGHCRRWLAADPRSFLTQLAQWEKALLGAAGKGPSAEARVEAAGEEAGDGERAVDQDPEVQRARFTLCPRCSRYGRLLCAACRQAHERYQEARAQAYERYQEARAQARRRLGL